MKRLLVFALALAIAFPAFAEDFKFTVNVDNGGEIIKVIPRAEHLRMSCATAGLSFTAYSYIYNSDGTKVGTQRHPRLGTGTDSTYPLAATDSTYTIYDTSVTAWNTFNNVPADSIAFHNATGSAVDVIVEYRR